METVTEPYLEIDRLSKRYTVRRAGEPCLWALRDISLRAHAGEILGVIGRNGAGKSTLLKILAGITDPSSGTARLRGRPASLLELGTGFHPELSGRENVYLNAALFGMTRAEVRRQFDTIVAFSGVESFIDTPIKHYSSGMAVRLAFSVAAHLDRQVILVDEALAVGDVEFQRKSVARIQELAAGGACVLLVSHNLGLVERLCSRSLLLHQGCMQFLGPSPDAVRAYLRLEGDRPCECHWPAAPNRALQLRRIAVAGPDGTPRGEIGYHEGLRITVDYDLNREVEGTNVGIGIAAAGGALLFASAEFDCRPELRRPRPIGTYRAEVAIPPKWINVGRYHVQIYWTTGMQPSEYAAEPALSFDVIETGTPAARQGQSRHGLLQPELDWQVRRIGESSQPT
jgi:lipopolysaccharide transport system ATP-binding protein